MSKTNKKIELLDELTEKDMAEAIDDIKKKRVSIVNKEAIRKHIRRLAQDTLDQGEKSN